MIGKAARTGGCVTLATVKEQLLYEVHDPAAYLTPDVTADIREARVAEAGPDRVALSGVRGHERPATLKVTAFYEGGWLAEGEISYAGPGAESRARLAAEILAKRLPDLRLRVDLIGVVSVFADDAGRLLAAHARRAMRATCACGSPPCTRIGEAAERLVAGSDRALYLRAGRRRRRAHARSVRVFRRPPASCRARRCRRVSTGWTDVLAHRPPSHACPWPHRRQGKPLEHQRDRPFARSSGTRS